MECQEWRSDGINRNNLNEYIYPNANNAQRGEQNYGSNNNNNTGNAAASPSATSRANHYNPAAHQSITHHAAHHYHPSHPQQQQPHPPPHPHHHPHPPPPPHQQHKLESVDPDSPIPTYYDLDEKNLYTPQQTSGEINFTNYIANNGGNVGGGNNSNTSNNVVGGGGGGSNYPNSNSLPSAATRYNSGQTCSSSALINNNCQNVKSERCVISPHDGSSWSSSGSMPAVNDNANGLAGYSQTKVYYQQQTQQQQQSSQLNRLYGNQNYSNSGRLMAPPPRDNYDNHNQMIGLPPSSLHWSGNSSLDSSSIGSASLSSPPIHSPVSGGVGVIEKKKRGRPCGSKNKPKQPPAPQQQQQLPPPPPVQSIHHQTIPPPHHTPPTSLHHHQATHHTQPPPTPPHTSQPILHRPMPNHHPHPPQQQQHQQPHHHHQQQQEPNNQPSVSQSYSSDYSNFNANFYTSNSNSNDNLVIDEKAIVNEKCITPGKRKKREKIISEEIGVNTHLSLNCWSNEQLGVIKPQQDISLLPPPPPTQQSTVQPPPPPQLPPPQLSSGHPLNIYHQPPSAQLQQLNSITDYTNISASSNTNELMPTMNNIYSNNTQTPTTGNAAASKKKPWGPYVHVEKNAKNNQTIYSIVNVQKLDDEKDLKRNRLNHDNQTKMIPYKRPSLSKKKLMTLSQQMDPLARDVSWICALCKQGPHYNSLGDLYGPYFVKLEQKTSNLNGDTNENRLNRASPKKFYNENLGDKKNNINNNLGQFNSCINNGNSNNNNGLSNIEQQEVWFHEDCIVWSNGVYLAGNEVRNVEEIVKDSQETMCSGCKLSGATLGCLHKGCMARFHYLCAQEKGCKMNEENFSIYCTKHKAKLKEG